MRASEVYVSETDSLLQKKIINDISSLPESHRLWLFCIPSSWISAPQPGTEVVIKNNPTQVIYLILNAMIGSGILAQAYVFSRAGWVSAFLEYLVVGYLIYTGAEFLIISAEELGVSTYARLCESALGSIGKPFLEIAIITNNMGCVLSYLIVIGSLMERVAKVFVDEMPEIINASFFIIVVTLFILLPICLIRNFGHLVIVSTFSVMAITAVVILVVVGGPLSSHNTDLTWSKFSFSGSIDTIGSVIFAFGYAAVLFPTYSTLYPRKAEVFNSITYSATIIGAGMCLCVGIMGDWSFRSDTKADILENFNGLLGLVFQLVVIFHLVMYIPGDFVVMRASFMNLLGRDAKTESDGTYVAITVTVLGLIAATACLVLTAESSSASLAAILDITGGVSGSIINFLAPGLVARQVLWKQASHITKRKIVALIVFGSAVPILVIITTLRSSMLVSS